MSNNQNQNSNNNDNAAVITDSVTKMANSLAYLKQALKQQKDNFSYTDVANHIATCNSCGEEFNVDYIPANLLNDCKQHSICPRCAVAPIYLKLIYSKQI